MHLKVVRPLLAVPLVLIGCSAPAAAVPSVSTQSIPTVAPTQALAAPTAVDLRATAIVAVATANAALPTRPPATETPLPKPTTAPTSPPAPTAGPVVYLGLRGSSVVPVMNTEAVCTELLELDDDEDAFEDRLSSALADGETTLAAVNTPARVRTRSGDCEQVDVADGPLQAMSVWIPQRAVQTTRLPSVPTPVPTRAPVIAPAARTRPFVASLTGAAGTRFTLTCLRYQPNGSSTSVSFRGAVPADYQLGDAAVVSCVGQKLSPTTQGLSLRITSAGTVLGTSDTGRGYGVVTVATS